ncbi:MAG TPA: hypothetical protein VD837_06270 [Terriglobales bacterium]|nr:hypothetical protein [Terriglobales bacterium]
MKWRFFEDERQDFEVATYPQLEFNNPSHSVERGLVERGTRLLLPVEIAKKLGPIDVNPELGYWFVQRGRDEFFVGTAVGRRVASRLELLAETYSIGSAEERETTFGFGATIALNQSIRAMLMAGRSVTGASNQPTFIGYGGIQFVIESQSSDKADVNTGRRNNPDNFLKPCGCELHVLNSALAKTP